MKKINDYFEVSEDAEYELFDENVLVVFKGIGSVIKENALIVSGGRDVTVQTWKEGSKALSMNEGAIAESWEHGAIAEAANPGARAYSMVKGAIAEELTPGAIVEAMHPDAVIKKFEPKKINIMSEKAIAIGYENPMLDIKSLTGEDE